MNTPTSGLLWFLLRIPNARKVERQAVLRVAAFDTRISTADVRSRLLKMMARLFGYAAKPIADGLQKKGGALAAPPEGFFVEATKGPLKHGEIERATTWARTLLKT